MSGINGHDNGGEGVKLQSETLMKAATRECLNEAQAFVDDIRAGKIKPETMILVSYDGDAANAFVFRTNDSARNLDVLGLVEVARAAVVGKMFNGTMKPEAAS